MSQSLHHGFLTQGLAEEKMQTGEILLYASNQFEDRVAASSVPHCFARGHLCVLHTVQLVLKTQSSVLSRSLSPYKSILWSILLVHFLLTGVSACLLCLFYWCFHQPSIPRQTNIPGTSSISDPVNFSLHCLLALDSLSPWHGWEQKDLSESKTWGTYSSCTWKHTLSNISDHCKTCCSIIYYLTVNATPIIISLAKHYYTVYYNTYTKKTSSLCFRCVTGFK